MNRMSKTRTVVSFIGIGTAAAIAYFSLPQNGSQGHPLPIATPVQTGSIQAPSSRSSATTTRNQQEPRPLRSAENQVWMASIREAGLHGDRSLIPEMIAALEHPKHPDMIKIALHALAHLGATEALPAIDSLIRNDRTDPDDGNYAVAARARLVAEYTSAPVTDPVSRAAAKISRLQRETGLSASRMNVAARNYRANARHSYDREQPAEVYVMRELADIAYREHYRSPNGVPGAEGVDFSQDPASALKVQVAALPESQRVTWLVQDLAHSTKVTEATGFEIELAADEGLPASRAAALQLQEMIKHRDQYALDGFANMSQLMRCIGDKSQLPLVEQLRHDETNPNLARDWYITYGYLSHGTREFGENGY